MDSREPSHVYGLLPQGEAAIGADSEGILLRGFMAGPSSAQGQIIGFEERNN
jgi:hypothetical protein